MSESIASQVKQVIASQLQVDVSEVADDKSFTNDLGADSLDMVELVMAMEETFHLEIPDEEAERIQTVQDAINYIARNVQPAA